MAVPVSTYLRIADVCQYLSADGSSKNLLFKGTSTRPNQSRLIYMVRKAVQWQSDIDPNAANLPKMANYMYSLCNPFVAAANVIINAGATGEIINPSTGNQVTVATPFEQFRVGDPGALMTAGETTLTLNYSGVVNPSVEITLDGGELPYGEDESLSYTVTYNPTNIEIVFSAGVQNGQLYIIHMVQLVNV
jgi:hypothetical protein